jgi:hypothetical protein
MLRYTWWSHYLSIDWRVSKSASLCTLNRASFFSKPHIQGVPGGMCPTSGGCSLCKLIVVPSRGGKSSNIWEQL